MRKDFWNGTLLACWALCLCSAHVTLGGLPGEYALPMYLCGAALALVWAMKLLWSQEVSWIWTPLHVPVLGLVAYAGLRVWTAPLRHEAEWELLQIGLYALVYFVTAFSFYRSRYRTALLLVVTGLAVAEAIYGYWQYATGNDRVLWYLRPAQYHGRGSGTYICPNHLAGWLEMVALVLLAQIVVNPRPLKSLEHSFIIKLLEFSAFGVILAGLFATQSRGGWMALAVGGVLFWLWAWRTQWMPPRVADATVLALLAAIVAALTIPDVRERISETLSLNLDYTFRYDILRVYDPHLEGRVPMTQASWWMFLDHLWVGTGPGSWRWFHPQYRPESMGAFAPLYAHNDLFQFAAEYGLVGVLLLVSALGCFCWQSLWLTRRSQPNGERAMALGGFLAVGAMLVHSLVDFNLHIPANALLTASIIGLVAALGDNTHFRRRRLPRAGKTALAVVLLLVAAAIAWNGFRLCAAQRYLLNGRNAQAAREWTEALRHYRQAAAVAPHFAEPHARMGEVYRFQYIESSEDGAASPLLSRALTAYQEALQRNPRDAAVWLQVALLYERMGNISEAMTTFDRVFALDPYNPHYLIEYGQFLERRNQYDAALRAYEKAARQNDPEAGHLLRQLRQRLSHQNR